jgi:hypothetical protein
LFNRLGRGLRGGQHGRHRWVSLDRRGAGECAAAVGLGRGRGPARELGQRNRSRQGQHEHADGAGAKRQYSGSPP